MTTEEVVEQLVQNLTIERSDLSSVRRKKTSAQDDRKSSQTFGVVGVIVISIVCGSVVLLDIPKVILNVKRLCRNSKKKRKTNRKCESLNNAEVQDSTL